MDETQAAPVDERKALRAEYEKVIGKPPYMGWNADELRSRITVARAAASLQNEGPGPRTGEPRVQVVITADARLADPHVYLPLEEWDAENKVGIVPDEWRNVPGPLDSIEGMSDNEKMELAKRLDPRKVPDRARLDMPRSCADHLLKTNRCVILESKAA